MKRTGKKNIQLLRNVISTFSGDIPRKTIVNIAIKNGLIEKDTYPLIKPTARGNERGTYNVDKMLELADKILKNGKKEVSVKKVIKKLIEEVEAPVEKVEEIVESKNYGNVSWGELAYTEDDINDELSLMGTYL
jgi:hypothetical protein